MCTAEEAVEALKKLAATIDKDIHQFAYSKDFFSCFDSFFDSVLDVAYRHETETLKKIFYSICSICSEIENETEMYSKINVLNALIRTLGTEILKILNSNTCINTIEYSKVVADLAIKKA